MAAAWRPRKRDARVAVEGDLALEGVEEGAVLDEEFEEIDEYAIDKGEEAEFDTMKVGSAFVCIAASSDMWGPTPSLCCTVST